MNCAGNAQLHSIKALGDPVLVCLGNHNPGHRSLIGDDITQKFTLLNILTGKIFAVWQHKGAVGGTGVGVGGTGVSVGGIGVGVGGTGV